MASRAKFQQLLLVLAPAIAPPLIARATIRRDCSRVQGESYHVASIRTGWDTASRDRR